MSDTENNCDNDVRRSSRRRESKKVTNRKSALESLREARASGKSYRPNLDVNDVYDVVDEKEYNSIVAQRQNDNFIVDDDGMGYVDTGADFEDEYEDDYDEYEDSSSKKEKKNKKDKKEKKKKGALDSFFSSGTSKKPLVDESKVKLDLDEDEDLKNMLGDILDGDNEDDEPISRPAPTSRNPFKRDRTSSPQSEDIMAPRPIAKKARTTFLSKAQPTTRKTVPNAVSEKTNRNEMPSSSRNAVQDDPDDYDDEYDYGVPDEAEEVVEPVKAEIFSPPPKKTDSRNVDNSVAKFDKTEDVTKVESMEVDTEEDDKAAAKFLLNNEQWEANDQEEDEEKVEIKTGSEAFYVMGGDNGDQKAVRMYWIDAFEDSHKNTGTVFLFGRVKVNDSKWASCCCVVKNIYRQVFFLPKETNSNDEPVQQVDVFNEIGKVLKRSLNVVNFKCRATEKKLMNDKKFGDLAGEKTNVMEVLYESSSAKLPSDLKGETFSQVFNTSTTPLERLLVDKKFMGPGWIEVFNFTEASAKMSNCEYEFVVDMEKMKNIRYLEGDVNKELPRVRLLALNVLTTLNEKKENEICMISMLYNNSSNFLNPTAYTNNLQRKCLVTKPVGGALPFDIRQRIQAEKWDQMVTSTANEKALLTLFLAKINEMEPDLIVGHDLSATVTVLVSRLEKLKIPNWSRISRLKRTINIGKVGHSKAGQWELTAGRLLLDSKLAAMELVKSRSYDLGELASQILGVKRQDIYVNDIGPMYSSSDRLLSLIKWSWMDPLLAFRVICQLNALPLFTQITNIVGGVASRTMMGGRADRNEYLLLHAFHKADLIAPDKYNPFSKKGGKNDGNHTMNEKKEDDGDDEKKTSGKSKAQYSGGLVLEPKKGLYDTLILLLDFNSLYPSIIQEYNICFTTVPHTKDSDDLPDVPSNVNDEGVLPREIRKLVECRRNVKSLMKTEKRDAEKKQLDIRQMALKLTANSMYGCLGFQYSRFYAKPLAALVTAKGREILMHSKDLVEKLGYSVIYGDTDSIMINTNSVDLAEAKKLGFEIKKAVNKCHRLLELDLDGVFKRMLLLKKKKYAALTINPETRKEGKELKGLDIVRRDWSQLAKETGADVVDRILDSNLTRDELVSSIDDLLKEKRSQLDSGSVPVEKFQISKQLTRNPKDYGDLKSQPHASVAKRLNESGRFNLRQGDIVEYIICEDGTDNPTTQRAYHRTEMEDNKSLKIDLLYYLAQQIHPVVSRLVAPIEETDSVRIAESLGMDSSNYRRAAAAQERQNADEEDYMWKQDNYDLCEGIVIQCPNSSCGQTTIIRETFDHESDESQPRLMLSSCKKCNISWICDDFLNSITNQIDRQMAEFVAKHMAAGYKCDEPACEYKTRVQTMKWCREGLECTKCSTGILRKEYTSKQLFDQQMFFRFILNVNEAMAKMNNTNAKHARTHPDYAVCQMESTEIMNLLTVKYLEKNSYNRVDLAYLFAPMLKLT